MDCSCCFSNNYVKYGSDKGLPLPFYIGQPQWLAPTRPLLLSGDAEINSARRVKQ